eukprot:1159763-Pelagomonas_calceolata.AAC.12
MFLDGTAAAAADGSHGPVAREVKQAGCNGKARTRTLKLIWKWPVPGISGFGEAWWIGPRHHCQHPAAPRI